MRQLLTGFAVLAGGLALLGGYSVAAVFLVQFVSGKNYVTDTEGFVICLLPAILTTAYFIGGKVSPGKGKP